MSTDTSIKYPHIHVRLSGEDGNAFLILGRCLGAMRKHGLSEAERQTFQAEAMASDYDQLLRTAMRWFDVT